MSAKELRGASLVTSCASESGCPITGMKCEALVIEYPETQFEGTKIQEGRAQPDHDLRRRRSQPQERFAQGFPGCAIGEFPVK